MRTKELKYFVLSRLEQSRQNKNLLNWHEKPNEPTKEGPLSFVLFESPFTSVSTVSRGHPSLVSLATPSPNPAKLARECYLYSLSGRQSREYKVVR
jgi:hypothetical protein